MLLSFSNGEAFANGQMPYDYPPPGAGETAARILIAIEIADQPTEAILDTGAPFVICSPHLVPFISTDATVALERHRILVRGSWVTGTLHRLPINFPAEEGDDLQVDSTVYLPDQEWADSWGSLPSFIGLTGCLERMRFAVDPDTDTFYFGPLTNE